MPKGPSNYNPFRHADAAIARRNWVIDRMVENGYVSQADGEDAKKQPLGVTGKRSGGSVFASEFFSEEVRRQIIDKYGDKALYEGGLSVRTSLDPQLQIEARKALQDGLVSYDERRGFHGPIKQISTAQDWGGCEACLACRCSEWHMCGRARLFRPGRRYRPLQPDVDGGGRYRPTASVERLRR